MRERAISLRMPRYALGEGIRCSRVPDGWLQPYPIRPGHPHGLREYDVLDVACIHLGQAHIIEVRQPGFELPDELGRQDTRVLG